MTSSMFLQPSRCLAAPLTPSSLFRRALFLMSKSSFQPPRLKDKNKWWVSRMPKELFHGLIKNQTVSSSRSTSFHNFVKVSLTKNPKKRPTAEKLLTVMQCFLNM